LAGLSIPLNATQNVLIKKRILIAENLRHSFLWVFDPAKLVK
jgi:hypothetical protein